MKRIVSLELASDATQVSGSLDLIYGLWGSDMLGKVNGRWGTCTYFLKDEYVGRSVRNYGEYNPDETEKILELARLGEPGVCLDIGANIGCISQALVASGETVIAYEPQPEVYKLLVENGTAASQVGAGERGKFTAYNCALGSASGETNMPKVHYSEKGNFGGLSCGSKSLLGDYTVPVNVLDSLLDVGRVKLMKIDVEGWEIEVLRGARSTIMRDRPIMYIEDDRVDKSYALRKYITEELKYTIEEHRPPLYREENFFGLKKSIWDKNYVSHNIICMPC